MIKSIKNIHSIGQYFLLFSLLCLSQVITGSHAAGLPPAATPGGALPKEPFKYPEPFVYPDTTPPPEIEEKLEQVEKDAPRIRIKGFRITGVDETPEVGITQQSVELLVKETAEKLLSSVASQGFTISMLENITSTIARFYRQRGFFLARAYIPEQTVNDGIVQINIVEGFLDRVIFKGNELYSDKQLMELFDPVLGEAVFKEDIEQVLFTLNDYPGLSSSMVFGPGLKPGSAAIQLNSSEIPSRTSLAFDNFGSIYTGENRWLFNHQRNNTFSQADRLDLSLIMTTNPPNTLYMDAFYQQPVIDHRFMAGGGIIINNFDVGGNLTDLGINGESQDLHGFMKYQFNRDRSENISASAGLHLKSAVSKVQTTVVSEDKLTVLYLSGDYAGTSWSSTGVYQVANITLSLGLEDFLGSMDGDGNGTSSRTGGSGAVGGGGFSKLSYSYIRAYYLSQLQSLIFSFRGQMSSDLLTSLEQFSLGGPDTVRAYPVSEALMDKANVFTVEWLVFASPDIPQTLLNKLQFSVFYDYAKGTLNDPLQNDVDSVTLSGFGGSVQLEPYGEFTTKLTLAFDTGDEPSDNMSWPFYFSLNYEF